MIYYKGAIEMKKKLCFLMIIPAVFLLSSCAPKITVGNDFNNIVLMNSRVCESEDYVFYSKPNAKTNANDVYRINKTDGSVGILPINGYSFNIYDNYLYYYGGKADDKLYHSNSLYRIDLEAKHPVELVADIPYTNSFFILNDYLYMEPNYSQIYRIDLKTLQTEPAGALYAATNFIICGTDGKYIYGIYSSGFEEANVGGVQVKKYTLYRASADLKTKEAFLEIYFPDCFTIDYNNAFIISGGYIYFSNTAFDGSTFGGICRVKL